MCYQIYMQNIEDFFTWRKTWISCTGIAAFFTPSTGADLEIRHAPRALQVVETTSF